MNYYFSHISHNLRLANNLEKSVYNYLCEQERKVIPVTEVEAFRNTITAEIQTLNNAHPRCKPIAASWWQPQKKSDYYLSGVGFCTYNLYSSSN